MPTLVACLSTGKGTWGHVSKLIETHPWDKIFLVTNEFGKENFTKNSKTELILVDPNQGIKELQQDIYSKLRENENQYIATCIKPLFQKRNGKNLIIHGPPGVGKTLATKNVLKELEEETDDITPVYVNCWKKNTTYQVVLELCKAIDYKFTQNKRTDELISIIVERLNKKSSVLVFDEIDKIQELDILYNLSESLYRKTIILLTNESNWLFRLDSRLKSRLIPDQLEFKPYSLTETKEILKQRISQAFPPNTINENSLNKITENPFKQTDIRTGLFIVF